MGSSRCSTCADEKRTMAHYRRRLIFGLLLPFMVQSLDVTIISGALPFIASDFHQLSQLNWIVSAFNLCSATFIPAWGQFADVFGRYAAMQGALFCMILGSALAAGSPVTAFPMLLVGRAIQGMGCAGLNILTNVILADKVSLAENAKNKSLFTLVSGVGYGIGPVIGGYLTQVSWRWCFIINIPIGVAGIIIVHFVLRPVLLGPQEITRTDGTADSQISPGSTFIARLSTFDLGGQFLFLFGLGLLILALTWAGSYYPWHDVKVIVPLTTGLVLLLAFIRWEYLMIPGSFLANRYPHRQAMIPLKLLCTRNVGILIYINLITGMAMYAVFYFVDLYFALVLSYPSGKAGQNLLYYLPGLAAGAYAAMFACNVYPRKTYPPLLLGTLLEALGITLLAVALRADHLPLIYAMMALTGVGTGLRFMPATLHGVGYYPAHIARVVALLLLSSSLGGALATTVMLNIFNHRLSGVGIDGGGGSVASLDAVKGLSEGAQVLLRDRAREGISLAFFAVSSFMWLGLVAMVGLGNVDIGREGAGREENVSKGSYLGSLVRGRGLVIPLVNLDVPGARDSNLGEPHLGRHIRFLSLDWTRQLLQANDHAPLIARPHQILITSPAIMHDLRRAKLPPSDTTRAALSDIEPAPGIPVLVLRLLVATVLEEGTEDHGVGGESNEEDVEGGDEGAEVLLSAVIYHHR
ncbi:Efflux pump FUS6 [Hyphodiscus hymeniophilus]|uniref:Efflux pump FUS6 n=1 Tax=Hyphodiscus hymeniophilus TaxID=353542 RepID=A0A9P6SKG7_9HELO|nr:Efflux pump FUS6 [Hyphodiscus hymeniophilus]